MSARATRRAFLGTSLAVAAGAGATRLPDVVAREFRRKETLALEARGLSAAVAHPSFGTLRAQSSGDAVLQGTLHERAGGRSAGTVSIATVPGGTTPLHVVSLALAGGSLAAIRSEGEAAYAVRSGTGRYANARGSISVKSAAHAALALDIELEL